MFPVQALIKSAPSVCRTVMQKRTNIISGVPNNKISFAEKMTLGGIMITSICIIPAWVLVHIQNYQHRE